MSNQQPPGPGPGNGNGTVGNGPSSAPGWGGYSAPGSAQGGQGTQGPPPAQNLSSQNLNQIVIEYLVKKGYRRTEQTLRNESSNVDKDGKPLADVHTAKFASGYRLLKSWIKSSLDIYKLELSRTLWPVFIYAYLELILNHFPEDAKAFLDEFGSLHEKTHHDELADVSLVTLPAHVATNATTQLYRTNKYRIPLNNVAYQNLLAYLESDSNYDVGGATIAYLLSTYCEIRTSSRGPIDQHSFQAIINQARGLEQQDTDQQEGIPGAFVGVSALDMMDNAAPLKLGPMPMESELAGDVRAELEEEDRRSPPELGQPSLLEEFERRIKREESADGPNRNEIPLPPSRARDVVIEVQKVKENRDRFKIDGRTGGVGPAISVCMFTLHNTLDTITCMEFSDDNNLLAVGTEESYIRIWNMHGENVPSLIPGSQPSSSRRLIGHSASVYSVAFSPSIESEPKSPQDPSTAPLLLLSCSSDRTIRLWSLETFTCLVVYKGHEGPVWNVRWGPFGHYFVSCGWDKTVRVWAQDHISYLRMMVGHDTNANQIAWHPNGAYVFSASDSADKSVRMWSVTTGECVRVFTGHTDFISTLECSPDGKILASADGGGSIILWDLAKGVQIKRCKGHKGPIWSLSFSVESTVLVSGGSDGTVRVWDVEVTADSAKNTDGEVVSTQGQVTVTAQPVGGRKKGRDTTITPDQLSAFPTKKSPVYKVKFTRMNLALAGGCYMP